MGAELKIDSDEAYRLAAELASLRRESIESVVTTALREALERGRKAHGEEKDRKRLTEEDIAQIRAIAADIRQDLKHPLPSSDHNYLYDYLYDDGIASPTPLDRSE